jgi:hypothetical protein
LTRLAIYIRNAAVKILKSTQIAPVSDAVRAKFAMAMPVLEATLHSLERSRIKRLGGVEKITLRDLARETREGDGDMGICFEYSVHQAIATRNRLVHPLVSEILEKHCKIKDGADSLLFGPEKDGVIPILESVTNALTEEARLYVGNAGRPPQLKKYIPQIINAFRRHEARNKLPRSITGAWKADLFLGNVASQQFVGTTVKINPETLEGAKGLRIGIYPKRNAKDVPRKDDTLNLVRVPLPYDGAFMEAYYKSFFLVRAFLRADAKVPSPASLPDAEDRFVTGELQSRADYPVVDVVEALEAMAQTGLLTTAKVEIISPSSTLSTDGLDKVKATKKSADAVSLTPEASEI